MKRSDYLFAWGYSKLKHGKEIQVKYFSKYFRVSQKPVFWKHTGWMFTDTPSKAYSVFIYMVINLYIYINIWVKHNWMFLFSRILSFNMLQISKKEIHCRILTNFTMIYLFGNISIKIFQNSSDKYHFRKCADKVCLARHTTTCARMYLLVCMNLINC